MAYFISLGKFPAALATLVFLGVTLAGCNTLEGAGEDIEGAGEEIQDAAGR